MKRRRLIISLFLIVAVVLLGIGYSAISYRLDIKGSVSSVESTADFHVEFVDAKLGSKTDESITCVPTIDSATKIDATLNISGLSNHGQEVVAYFKVQNNSLAISSLNATLENLTIVITKNDVAVTDNDGSANKFKGQFIEVEAVFADTFETENATGKVAEGGLTATVNTKNGETAAQYVWVKVTVRVIGSFTAETTHGITVHFDAKSN